MFAILVPATLFPLISTLLWAENRAKKLGVLDALMQNDGRPPTDVAKQKPLLQRIYKTSKQLDVFGLVLIGACVSLILLPLTLARNARGEWKNRLYHIPSSSINVPADVHPSVDDCYACCWSCVDSCGCPLGGQVY